MTGSSSSSRDDGAESRVTASRRAGSRVLIVSMAVSAVIHAAAVLLYPVLVRQVERESAVATDREPPPRFRATEVIRLAESEEPEEAVAPDLPEPEPEPEPEVEPAEEEEVDPVPEEEAGADEEPDGPTAAERLRPSEADPRIWRPVSPERTELTDRERARLRILGKLQAWNDSVAAEGALGPNVDWTFTDDEGRRWGLSPGKLHLGGLTLPMPSFWGSGNGAGNLEETLERLWEIQDIEDAATREGIRAILEERAREIRRRKDRDRRDGADSTGGGG